MNCLFYLIKYCGWWFACLCCFGLFCKIRDLNVVFHVIGVGSLNDLMNNGL